MRAPLPIKQVLYGLLMLSVMTVAGCSRDEEAKVRAALAPWVTFDKTLFFNAKTDCLAAMFHAPSGDIKAALRLENNAGSGLRVLHRDGAVALRFPGLSPTQVSEIIATADFPVGVSVIALARVGQGCMDAAYEGAFVQAIHDTNSILILDKKNVAMAVLDPVRLRLFYLRGGGR